MDNFSDLIPAELADDFADFLSDFRMCELCDNYTPIDYCDKCEESTCQYCLEAYGCDGIFPLHP
jgi:recombinational DNA repair protein RecR